MQPLLTPDEEIRAHGSANSPLPRAVSRLRDLLGAKMVAYLGGVKETRAVTQWATGVRAPSASGERRIRDALQIAELIVELEDPGVARAWFQGMNPHLDDVAPARFMRESPSEQGGPIVLAAARSFLSNR